MWLGWLIGSINGLMRSFGVLQNSMELIARPIEVVDAPDARDWAPEGGAIRFDNVDFGYLDRQARHRRISISTSRRAKRSGLSAIPAPARPPSSICCCASGTSKSGRILIDGADISKVTQDSLRAAIGVVTQEPALLHRSVRDNILYGRPGASDAEVVAAAKKAAAHEFILDLKDPDGRTGYDAHVGERGIKLSGGQRQRIAIARVMLKNAPILVLDEATSALDSEIEAAIQEQLSTLMARQDRARHRPSPVDHRRHGPADRHRRGQDRRTGQPRRTAEAGRHLRRALGPPVRRVPRQRARTRPTEPVEVAE